MSEEEFDKEMLELLNDNEYSEAMKEFRRYHGYVNKWVCTDCGFASDTYAVKDGCGKCNGRNVTVKIVRELVTRPAPDPSCIEQAEAYLKLTTNYLGMEMGHLLEQPRGHITRLIADCRVLTGIAEIKDPEQHFEQLMKTWQDNDIILNEYQSRIAELEAELDLGKPEKLRTMMLCGCKENYRLPTEPKCDKCKIAELEKAVRYCIKQMQGSNCNELHVLEKALPVQRDEPNPAACGQDKEK